MATFCSCENNVINNAISDPAQGACRPQQPGRMVMNCGCGSVCPLLLIDLLGASIRNPYSVASVTLNTR